LRLETAYAKKRLYQARCERQRKVLKRFVRVVEAIGVAKVQESWPKLFTAYGQAITCLNDAGGTWPWNATGCYSDTPRYTLPSKI